MSTPTARHAGVCLRSAQNLGTGVEGCGLHQPRPKFSKGQHSQSTFGPRVKVGAARGASLGREARQDDGFEFAQEQVGGLVVEVLHYVPCLGLGSKVPSLRSAELGLQLCVGPARRRRPSLEANLRLRSDVLGTVDPPQALVQHPVRIGAERQGGPLRRVAGEELAHAWVQGNHVLSLVQLGGRQLGRDVERIFCPSRRGLRYTQQPLYSGLVDKDIVFTRIQVTAGGVWEGHNHPDGALLVRSAWTDLGYSFPARTR
jgi:hypothetical protein